ncbi:MAG: winged helix-turn-helix domain-containing protein, partial [Xanthomonadales bacterium]|nr:winged helix-turn-helix domain-containing protein [Xanthomonadales bacterium]
MGEQTGPTGHYHFLHWHYVSGQRLLAGRGREVRLKPLLDRLLRRLLDEPGTVLTRECLIEQVWTRPQVNDEVLSRAIAELRAILGDDAREPRFIETLPKGGYRWIAPLELDHSPDTAKPTRITNSPTSGKGLRIARLVVPALAAIAVFWFAWQGLAGNAGRVRHQATLAVDLLSAQPLTADPRLEYDARFDPLGRVVYIRSALGSEASELIMVDPASR